MERSTTTCTSTLSLSHTFHPLFHLHVVSCLALHHGRRFSEGPIHVRRDRGYLIFQTRGPPSRARRVCQMALGRAGSWDVAIIKRFVWSFSFPLFFLDMVVPWVWEGRTGRSGIGA